MTQEYTEDVSIEKMIEICRENPEDLAETIKGTDTEKLAAFLGRHYEDELSKEEVVALLFIHFLQNEEASASYDKLIKANASLAQWFADYIIPAFEKYLIKTKGYAVFYSNNGLEMFVEELRLSQEDKDDLLSRIPTLDFEERVALLKTLTKIFKLDIEEKKALEKIRKYWQY